MQGRKGIKRVAVSFAASVVLLLAFGGGTAMAACTSFTLDLNQARADELVPYHIATCATGDVWRFEVTYPDGVDDQGNPKTETRTLHEDGTVESDGPIDGQFKMISLGDNARDITVLLTVTPAGQPRYTLETAFNYAGPAPPPPDTGPTGPASPSGATGPLTVAPLAVSNPAQSNTRSEAKKKAKKKKASKKKSTSGKSKSKSNSDNGSSNPTPTTPTYTPPATSTPTPSTVTPAVPDDFKTPNAPPQPPAAAPPGALGPGGGEPVVPTPPVPTGPATAPVATSGDDNGMSVPVWLVILLGLIALAGLGGAQARLLGLWGPPLPIGPDTSDARLLALQRVSQSGASFQKRIAELKKAAREREPVG